jgi:hypothetical protein
MQRAASRPVAGGASLDNGSLARLFWRALDAVTTGSCRRGCGAWMRSTALSRRPRPIGSGGVIARTSRACSASIERRGSPWPSPLDPALAAPSREHRPLFRCPPGRGDFVKVDCAACHHVALLTPEALLEAGLLPAAKVLDLKGGCAVGVAGGRDGRWFRSSGGGRGREPALLGRASSAVTFH